MSAAIIPFPVKPLTDLDRLREQHHQDLAGLAAAVFERAKQNRQGISIRKATQIARAMILGGPVPGHPLPTIPYLVAIISHQLYQQALENGRHDYEQ
jgi:hypothetical protein